MSYDAFNPARRKQPSLRRTTGSGELVPRHAGRNPGKTSVVARIETTAGRHRSRILVVALLLLVGVALYTLTGRSSVTTEGPRQREYARLYEDNDVDILPEKKHSPHELVQSGVGKQPKVVETIEVDPRPILRPPSRNPKEKYLAYHPHSVRELLAMDVCAAQPLIHVQGYHNQRISLENAIVLAKMLDRTLVVPPVWLGHAIPWISFDKLYNRLREARKYGLEHCRDIPKQEPIPWDCLSGYWDYTLVSWDLLVDLEAVAKKQPLVDGWDASYDWLEQELGINLQTEAAFIKDTVSYDYRVFDDPSDTTPLGKFAKRLDVDTLKQEYGQYRLLHFGSVYGTLRLSLTKPENRATRTFARQSMVFHNELLETISTTISARLGGQNAYLGLHLRLGDGVFRDKAVSNAEAIFDELVGRKLGLDNGLIAGLKQESRQLHAAKNEEMRAKRSFGDAMPDSTQPQAARAGRERRAKGTQDPHTSLPPLPIVRFRSESPLHPSLTCRGALHADPRLYALNTPIFLATDSKTLTTDPALQLFFDTFPCIFTLGDFTGSVPSLINADLPMDDLQTLKAFRNREDGVDLARFLYPMLDAMIAARGRDMLGTNMVSASIRNVFRSRDANKGDRVPSVPLQWMCYIGCIMAGR